jgi:hypothetical protein
MERFGNPEELCGALLITTKNKLLKHLHFLIPIEYN